MPGWRTITSVVRTPCVSCGSLAAALWQSCVSCGCRTPLRKRKQIAKKMNMSKIRCGSLATLFFVRQSCGVVYYTVRLPHEIQKFVDVDRCTAAARLMLHRLKACFTLIVRPFGRAFLSWVTERRGRETDRRQFHTESHLT